MPTQEEEDEEEEEGAEELDAKLHHGLFGASPALAMQRDSSMQAKTAQPPAFEPARD